jgi:signal transduction histidine kinase
MQPVYAGLFPVPKKDSTPFFAEISSAVLFDSEKKPRGMISIFRDVTDRIIQEDALSRSNAKLNLLAAVTRHDILNKITALMAHIELSRESRDLESMQAGLAKIDSIAGMLKEQIEFTRDYQDLGVKSPAWQNLAEVCSHAASQLDLGDVRFVNEAANLEVYADPLFEKVVCNILDNALRHGGGVSTIRVWCSSDKGNSTLSIEDDGAGIPAPDKTRIFDNGFGSHTGYGLFLAREILAITGMSISETGVPGNGARFDVIVPRGKFRIRPVS